MEGKLDLYKREIQDLAEENSALRAEINMHWKEIEIGSAKGKRLMESRREEYMKMAGFYNNNIQSIAQKIINLEKEEGEEKKMKQHLQKLMKMRKMY